MTDRRLQSVISSMRGIVPEVPPSQLGDQLKGGAILVDVREESEIAEGIIPGSLAIGRGNLEAWLFGHVPNLDTPIILYCESGNRSLMAAHSLREMGFERTMSLAGGLAAWKRAGFETTTYETLEGLDKKRFSRQIMLPEVGVHGQALLKTSRVLVVGVGGLGSPCVAYLAGAGIGKIGIVDSDTVAISNLHRQILFGQSDIGKPKVDAARVALERLNEGVSIVTYAEALNSRNAPDILRQYELVVDCTDNFEARYLINDTAVRVGIPLVHAAIYRFTGIVGVFNYNGGPCYRCVFPEPPPQSLAPSCADAGVLGVVTGLFGVIQAALVMKILLKWNQHEDFLDILQCDVRDLAFRKMRIEKRLTCRCGCDKHECGEGSKGESY